MDGGRPPGPGLQSRHGADEGPAGELSGAFLLLQIFSNLYFYSNWKKGKSELTGN